uniref:Uncharacterized protein n=1 Tax=Arundo donax TaxID=35708 RepID=A0A0A9PZQ7_ARUDO
MQTIEICFSSWFQTTKKFSRTSELGPGTEDNQMQSRK